MSPAIAYARPSWRRASAPTLRPFVASRYGGSDRDGIAGSDRGLSINPHQVSVTVFISSLAWEIWETLVRPEAPEGNTHMRGAAPIGNPPSFQASAPTPF